LLDGRTVEGGEFPGRRGGRRCLGHPGFQSRPGRRGIDRDTRAEQRFVINRHGVLSAETLTRKCASFGTIAVWKATHRGYIHAWAAAAIRRITPATASTAENSSHQESRRTAVRAGVFWLTGDHAFDARPHRERHKLAIVHDAGLTSPLGCRFAAGVALARPASQIPRKAIASSR